MRQAPEKESGTVRKSDLSTDGDASHVQTTATDTTGRPPIIYVNGAGANMGASAAGADDLSQRLGRNVQLVHNATEVRQFPDPIRNFLSVVTGGLFGDVKQVADDHRGVGNDPAVDKVRDMVLERLRAGQPVELAGHSQGNQTIAAALNQAYAIRSAELLEDRPELAREFEQVRVLNVSGPVKRQDYPPFIRYEHAELPGDPVPRRVGEGSDASRDADYDNQLVQAVLELPRSGGAHDPQNVLAEGGENVQRARMLFA